ncbi:LacI family DNA-binding transcriptional regulator [Gryllotalpicola sp.]|uniref:LacI family DNA-binding transcriptional regulator n=1 Tax=Gryllotalpicola sp. TaxID=1932787 RepID=UPI00261210B2|nr:LacI family DNA-binding transcriptional regulator [Gryllotalpicola sp.]
MTESPRPTLAAVAARAGVSASTASLAFSGTGPVSDATRDKVLAAARELGYAGPDPLARSLRRGRSGIVGVYLEPSIAAAFTDPVRILMLDGLSEAVDEVGASLLLITGPAGLSAAPLDAAVLLNHSPALDAPLSALRSRGMPVVGVEAAARVDGLVRIDQDNRAATALGARHLYQLGHRRVAVAALAVDSAREPGPVTAERRAAATYLPFIERYQGVRDVFPDAPAYAARSSAVDEGKAVGLALLDVPSAVRPTAIIAQSDLLAWGVIRAAESLGLRVPADVSVLGFDGVRIEGPVGHDLTTLVQPAVEKGRAAGQAIIRLLRGERVESQVFPSEFHEGNTTGPVGPA